MIEILVASEKQRITTEACASEKASVQKSDMGNSGHGGVPIKTAHTRAQEAVSRAEIWINSVEVQDPTLELSSS